MEKRLSAIELYVQTDGDGVVTEAYFREIIEIVDTSVSPEVVEATKVQSTYLDVAKAQEILKGVTTVKSRLGAALTKMKRKPD